MAVELSHPPVTESVPENGERITLVFATPSSEQQGPPSRSHIHPRTDSLRRFTPREVDLSEVVDIKIPSQFHPDEMLASDTVFDPHAFIPAHFTRITLK